MQAIRHIFAATDLTAASLRVVERGFRLAQQTGAHYTVMHALGLDALGPLRNLLGHKASDVAQAVLAHKRQELEAIVRDPRYHHGINARVLLEEGLATSVVPAYAATTDADLVLVGVRGASTLRRLLVGSTASRLLRKSQCPVLVVRHAHSKPYQRVLVPVDFSAGSLRSLQLARQLAPQARLVLLHVFEVPFEGMLQYAGVSSAEIQRYRAEAHVRHTQQLQQLAAQAGLADADYTGVVLHGDAVHHILELERDHHCDLIVMGKHGTHVTEELLLGSVTQRVLSQTHADMLVVVDKRGPGSA
ncbi:MAG: universal stress protein [Macromonas bipunctata]|nr:universal stress protein [Macromonas bipunctata]